MNIDFNHETSREEKRKETQNEVFANSYDQLNMPARVTVKGLNVCTYVHLIVKTKKISSSKLNS